MSFFKFFVYAGDKLFCSIDAPEYFDITKYFTPEAGFDCKKFSCQLINDEIKEPVNEILTGEGETGFVFQNNVPVALTTSIPEVSNETTTLKDIKEAVIKAAKINLTKEILKEICYCQTSKDNLNDMTIENWRIVKRFVERLNIIIERATALNWGIEELNTFSAKTYNMSVYGLTYATLIALEGHVVGLIFKYKDKKGELNANRKRNS